MAKFTPGVAQTTTTPTITIDAGSLNAGTYTFSLVVQDAQGNKSAPATVQVTITASLTAAIKATPNPAPFNTVITLDGGGSTAVGSQITQYIWTLMPNLRPIPEPIPRPVIG